MSLRLGVSAHSRSPLAFPPYLNFSNQSAKQTGIFTLVRRTNAHGLRTNRLERVWKRTLSVRFRCFANTLLIWWFAPLTTRIKRQKRLFHSLNNFQLALMAKKRRKGTKRYRAKSSFPTLSFRYSLKAQCWNLQKKMYFIMSHPLLNEHNIYKFKTSKQLNTKI